VGFTTCCVRGVVALCRVAPPPWTAEHQLGQTVTCVDDLVLRQTPAVLHRDVKKDCDTGQGAGSTGHEAGSTEHGAGRIAVGFTTCCVRGVVALCSVAPPPWTAEHQLGQTVTCVDSNLR